MDDVAGAPAENRVKLILPGHRVAHAPAVLQAVEPIAVVPAPRPLAHVSRNRRDVADLGRRHVDRGFRQHGVLLADHKMAADRIERCESADPQPATFGLDLIEALDRLQIHDRVRRDQTILHHPEHVAAAAHDRRSAAGLPRLLRERDRALQIRRVRVAEGFHASTSRILSRVIGRSLMRRPIALNTAFATAATAGTLLDSPMLFAPYGPYPSSESMKMTSIVGVSRCVMTRAP